MSGQGRAMRAVAAAMSVIVVVAGCSEASPSVREADPSIAADIDAVVPTELPAATDTTVASDDASDAERPESAETPAPVTPSPDIEASEPVESTDEPVREDTSDGSTVDPDATWTRDLAPNGRRAPLVATTPVELAVQIAAADAALLDETTDAAALPDWGHLHQVAIRKLGYEPAWDIDVFTALPPEIVERTILHVSARRALLELHSGYDAADFIPAWQIVEPEPFDELVAAYRGAEAETGIDWEYLAAINLIETGMGRIRGLSSAGAQGPMQFLPTTWDEPGIGSGDINDAGDAIAAAARYLVRRGGPADMPGAIWGYNNSDNYVTAVLAYAELIRNDAAAYRALYHWEIYFSTDAGDVWLPTGFRTDDVLDLDAYLAANPWSIPDPSLQ